VSKDLPGVEPDASYSYDLLNHLTSASQGGNTLTFGYDTFGRNTSQTGPLGISAYQYDAADRRRRTTWQDGFLVEYDYDVVGNLTTILENGSGVLATYGYDDLGRRTGLTRGNGTVTSYVPDAVSRLSSLGQDLSGSAYDVTTSFTYNAADQITTRSRSNNAYAWTGYYNVSRGYAHNGLNQTTTAGSTSLGYDARGNLTNSGSDSFGYSSENLLTGASVGGVGVSLGYDPLMRLY
jgi:YD repeat-containing protein